MNLDEVVGEIVEGSRMIRQLARKTIRQLSITAHLKNESSPLPEFPLSGLCETLDPRLL
jgi:hypothetical protein